MRVIRLLAGIFFIVEGIRSGEYLLLLAGAIFTVMPLFNVGCCSVNNCAPRNDYNGAADDVITFEELK